VWAVLLVASGVGLLRMLPAMWRGTDV
jgi:hypothetical protein